MSTVDYNKNVSAKYVFSPRARGPRSPLLFPTPWRNPFDTFVRIQNPLANLSRSELESSVNDFVSDYNLQDIAPLLHKGALVAQRPDQFEYMPELDATEKVVLANEITHKWRQPRALYLTVILCSVGAAVQYVTPTL